MRVFQPFQMERMMSRFEKEFEINSTRLAERLASEKSVLIMPGDHFGIDHFLRVSFGLPHSYLRSGLDRIHDMIEELQVR